MRVGDGCDGVVREVEVAGEVQVGCWGGGVLGAEVDLGGGCAERGELCVGCQSYRTGAASPASIVGNAAGGARWHRYAEDEMAAGSGLKRERKGWGGAVG